MTESQQWAAGSAREMPELQRLPLGAVRPRGWLLAQMRRDLERGFAGRLDGLSPHVARDLFRDRLADATTHAAWWDAESRGNWLWGYTMLSHLADLPEHRARADELIMALRATQDEDGYLGIHALQARYPCGGVENGELWAQSRALMALLAHHELSADPGSLAAARLSTDLTLRQYHDARPHFGRSSTAEDRTGLTHGLCYVDALESLHENTGDARYLRFAHWLLEDFDAWPVPFPNDDLAAANLADPHRALRGHAVHTVEHLRAVALAGTQAEGRLQAAMRKVHLSCTPSGAVIGDESLHGLPGPTAAYEYCTLVETVFSLARIAQHHVHPALGDWIERLTFNAAQGARTADGRALSYLCSDTRLDAVAGRPDSYSRLSGRHGRFKLSPTHDDVACCCNPNSTRLLPHFLSAMWFRRSDAPGLVALAFGPSELRTRMAGCEVVLRQETAYPFEDRVVFSVEVSTPSRFSLHLRRPAWTRRTCVTGVDCRESGNWIEIEREWRGRTTFELQFDVPVRAELYPEGEVAIVRGPLQFVQPIAHASRVLRTHAQGPWCDEELVPSDPAAVAAATPTFDVMLSDLGLSIARDPGYDPEDPWTQAPIRLEGPGLELVPMGAAPLRRAAFLPARRTRA